MNLYKLIKSLKKNKIVPIIPERELIWKGCDTEKYHWWPMRETSENADDPTNNLFAKSGGLGKYDKLFETQSVKFQKNNYFREFNSTAKDAGWSGFCDLATILSCLYQYPRYSVKVKYNGNEIEFSPRDIEALMIVSCNNAIKRGKSIFLGERNNGCELDDVNEPYPTDLISSLKIICGDNIPFAMDIESKSAVWNYSYDKVIVIKHIRKPLRLNLSGVNIPKTGKTEYIQFNLTSIAYPKKKQILWGWVNYTASIKSEGWISKQHPDFIWKRYKKNSEWIGKSCINPEINTNIVYKIYEKSIKKGGVVNI